jgi:hypothetical protein
MTKCLVCRRIGLILTCLVLCLTGFAQGNSESTTPGAAGFTYKFENARFYIPLIEIDLNPDGVGDLRFKRGEHDEVLELKVKVQPNTLARIRELFELSSFLSSEEEYQAKRDFSNLGWMTIGLSDGKRERKVRFNYTTNPHMKELSDLFRGISTQEIHLFDIDTAQQFQPLDLPRQLDSLASSLRLGYIAEPDRMLAALREIASLDTLPLIARNQANRLIKEIEKTIAKRKPKN